MKNPLVLLIRDKDETFGEGLIKGLEIHYSFMNAMPGDDAWRKILKAHPDIVIHSIHTYSPACLKTYVKIKEDVRTRHMPILVIGPVINEEDYISCLGTGISDYISGQPNLTLIHHRIRNIIAQQATLKNVLNKKVKVNTAEVAVETHDEKFMKQVLGIIEANLSNPEFSVQELSTQLYISRVALYKKLFLLTGKSPIDFIRTVKMQRAMQLLKKSDLTIAEVAYEVGFNDPKYFSRFFKKEFTMLPSEFTRKKGSVLMPV